ncbi:lysophospholipid acyltransferase family protein [Spirosoma utsteinense]|uniref:1-acyl-sn-glycerol-3-phosphate acyltransferase n=1 Tax=Spirosoma utsteinense TaxID=2585773 RepID=A0ABR6W778_9BACT|nr:lysophospholipid acyltransferase family protein [Spirosoma utsteinense]MBC3786157.1 1-acyl-sn-glycerol-3-phosphate acyltransferase [Spirosoma utsteinense]MBC3792347.1 1-acyl-sn-glycerol-3-phosphate acyltransferase [Spirosoma utsteinense]
MKKLLDYVLSSIYLLYFGLVLLVFHALQVGAFHLFGKDAHKKTVDVMNGFIAYGWYLTGSTIQYRHLAPELPTDRPIVFVANHQSMFDISPVIWFLRRHTPIFVSKIELSHGIPGISYNLRKSGAALIDRKDAKQAIAEIARLGKHIQLKKHSAVIFPEGTRSATGQMRPFATGGLAVLLKRAPTALVVPVVIGGTGHFNPKGIFPLRSFSRMSWTVLPGIEPAGQTPEEIVRLAQEAIAAELAKPV